jgi:hypothetical protein
MRMMTTTSEIRRPLQHNSAMDASSETSAFSAGVEEIPVFGTTALTGLWFLRWNVRQLHAAVQCAFWLSANRPQAAEIIGRLLSSGEMRELRYAR